MRNHVAWREQVLPPV